MRCDWSHDDDHDDDHDDHDDDGDNEFEWGGSFMLEGDAAFTWIAQKTGSGDAMGYADPTMKMSVLPAATGDMETLEALQSEGNHALEEECTDVMPEGTIPVEMDACVRLVFDQEASETHFYIDASGVDYVAIFAEHFPTEFEQDRHFLPDADGTDIEPIECSERATQTDAVADASFLKKSSSLKLVSLGVFLGVRNDSECGEFCMNKECR